MRNKYSFLALTDHRNHSEQNSIYAILSELSTHSRCKKVAVASRGLKVNDLFFYLQANSKLMVSGVDSEFKYNEEGRSFKKDLYQASIADFDAILMRLPRPIEDAFLQWLKTENPDKVIINDPEGIIITSNKSFLLNFPDLCPPMKIVDNIEDIKTLASNYPIVLKPLKEYGGKGLIRISDGKVNDGSSDHELSTYFDKYSDKYIGIDYLAMQYLKNIDQGDKRIIVVDGEIMGASLRTPLVGSWLCNIAQGGTSTASSPDVDEINIIKSINPVLKKHGILIYGVDTLVDNNGKRVLSEINTLSIGGFPQAQKQSGKPIIKNTLNKIINYLDEQLI